MKERINHPEHYQPGVYEAINVIEAWLLNFNLGNVVKYICRNGKKDPHEALEELEKCRWYLGREIETRELITSVIRRFISRVIEKVKEVVVEEEGVEEREKEHIYSSDNVIKAWNLESNLAIVIKQVSRVTTESLELEVALLYLDKEIVLRKKNEGKR